MPPSALVVALNADSHLQCSCPYCGEILEYSPEAVGEAVECPKCHEKSQLPPPPPQSTGPDIDESFSETEGGQRPTAPVCEACGTELDLWQEDCPVCAARRRRNQLILTGAVAALVVVGAGGAAAIFLRPKPPPEPTVILPPPGPLPQPARSFKKVQSTNDLRVGTFELRKDPTRHNSVASGDVVNDSEEVHVNVRIDLDILAEDGFKLQTLHLTMNELPPHQTWHILATTSEPDAARVKFAGFPEDQ